MRYKAVLCGVPGWGLRVQGPLEDLVDALVLPNHFARVAVIADGAQIPPRK